MSCRRRTLTTSAAWWSSSTSELPSFPPDELEAVFGPGDRAVDAEPLGLGVPAATAGVWLVRVRDDAAVVKLVHENPAGHTRWPAAPSPEHPYYWRREPCFYESRLLERFGAGLRAPHCRGLFERSDGAVALWLEALSEPVRSLEAYGRAARSLGRMQGAAAADLPTEHWLSRRWLRAYLDLRLELTGPRSEEQEAALRALETGPQTFCHLDFYLENLFGDGDETILVDWAYCGLGALGEDPGTFVPDTLLDGLVAAERGRELEQVVWAGYRAGLSESGWSGEERAVRFAFCATAWLKYQWVAPALESWPLDDARKAQWRRTLPLINRLGEEASRLADR